jgi:RHS repeat-associated protein
LRSRADPENRRRQTMTVVGQPQVSYNFDNADRLTGITQGSQSVGFSYDSANRRTCLTLPNGVIVSYGYDNDSRVTSLSYGTGGSCSSPPSNLGNLVYAYDADGRVTQKTGSFAQSKLPQAATGNTFNAANEMTAFNGTTLTYDANGNLTNDGTNAYGWDARNHLTAISGGSAASFVYDGLGRRMSKTIANTATQFLYDGLNPVQELQSGTPSANLLTGLGIDEYFQRTDSAGARDYLTDILGSTLALTDSSGTTQTSYLYDPFGNIAVSGQASSNPYQFTGRENDGTGLDYYRARYYSPTTQRFVSQDPLDFDAGDTDLYEYAGDSPVSLNDPEGLQSDGPWHPEPGLKTSCSNADSCATLQAKISQLSRFLSSHRRWDQVNGPGRHTKEINDRINEIENCKKIYNEKCKCDNSWVPAALGLVKMIIDQINDLPPGWWKVPVPAL